MASHAEAEQRSIALHRAVAERLRADPSLLDRARDRVSRWRADGSVHLHYVDEWEEVLSRPFDDVLAFIVEDSERARELRQVSPFAGVLAPRERWRILREVSAR